MRLTGVEPWPPAHCYLRGCAIHSPSRVAGPPGNPNRRERQRVRPRCPAL